MNTFFNQAQQTQKEHSNDNGTIAKKKKKKIMLLWEILSVTFNKLHSKF